MLGIFIGIAAVVSLISLGQGMQDAINSAFATIGTDKVILEAQQAGFGPPGTDTVAKITEHDLELVRHVPGVRRAAGRTLQGVNVEFAENVHTMFMADLPKEDDARDLVVEAFRLRIRHGRELKPTDRGSVVVGNDLMYKEVFPKPVRVNSRLLINGKRFKVVGVMEKSGQPGRDEVIIMNREDARDLLGLDDELSAVVAQTEPGEKVRDVAERIARAVRQDRHQQEGFEDFTVQTSEELIKSVNTVLTAVQLVLIGIAAISLLVGGIGIMNTMYTAVLERTGEIGVMKAIGARNGDIMLLFLVESGMLGMVGASIGILLGMGFGIAVEKGAEQVFGPNILQASFSPALIIGALLFGFIVGTLSGILPARQAAGLKPVEALRYE
jgi:putative ABC transport system permease protein